MRRMRPCTPHACFAAICLVLLPNVKCIVFGDIEEDPIPATTLVDAKSLEDANPTPSFDGALSASKALQLTQSTLQGHDWAPVSPTQWHQRDAARRRPTVFANALVGPLSMCSAVTVLVVTFTFCLYTWSVRTLDEPERARSAMLPVQFVSFLFFTLPILDSYDLFDTIGEEANLSGLFVGVYFLGGVFASVIVWGFLRYYPSMWRRWSFTILVVGHVCGIFGALAYLLSAAAVDIGYVHDPVKALLICGRFASGMGYGFCAQIGQTLYVILTPSEDRPWQMTRWFLANTMGIGFGPLGSVLVLSSFDLRSSVHTPLFSAVPLSMLCILTVTLIWLAIYWPKLEEVTDHTQSCEVADNLPVARGDTRMRDGRLVISGCLIMSCFRGYAVSSLEVATAMVLEVSLKWDMRLIGFTISLTFLGCIPVRFVYLLLKDKLSVIGWIRTLSLLSLIGCSLLFAFGAGHGPVLIAADALIFPTLYLADSLARGVMQQNLLPRGYLFADTSSVVLWTMVFTDGVGRFIGPWFARWCLQVHSMNFYVAGQIIACVAFIVPFELLVVPFAKDQGNQKIPAGGPRPDTPFTEEKNGGVKTA